MYDYQQNINLPAVKRLIIVSDEDFGRNDAYVREIRFSHKRCVVEYSQDLTGNGVMYNGTITASLPKLQPDFQEFLLYNGEKRWVCLAEDWNGFTHLLGGVLDSARTDRAGAVLVVAGSTGSPGGRNGYELTFTARSPVPFTIKQVTAMNALLDREVVDLRTAGLLDILVNAGDDFLQDISLYDDGGEVIDLTGSVITMTVSNVSGSTILNFTTEETEIGDGDEPEVIPASITLEEDGTVMRITKPGSEMNVPAGVYPYSIKRVYDGETATVMKGSLMVY